MKEGSGKVFRHQRSSDRRTREKLSRFKKESVGHELIHTLIVLHGNTESSEILFPAVLFGLLCSVPPIRPSPLTSRISPDTLARLQTETERLELSVNACVLQASRQLAALLESGWRPKATTRGPATAQLLLRLSPEQKAALDTACSNAKFALADFLRLAATAALLQIEGKRQILWPLELNKSAFNDAARVMAAKT